MGKRVNVLVPDEVHLRARLLALPLGLTLQQMITRGLELAADEIEEKGRVPYDEA